MMQADIVEKVEVTPEEVRQFFDSIPEEDLPVFGTEAEIAQIVVEPQVTEEEKKTHYRSTQWFQKRRGRERVEFWF